MVGKQSIDTDDKIEEAVEQEVTVNSDDKIAVIEDWFSKHFKNACVEISTEIYNLIHAAKEELKTLV